MVSHVQSATINVVSKGAPTIPSSIVLSTITHGCFVPMESRNDKPLIKTNYRSTLLQKNFGILVRMLSGNLRAKVYMLRRIEASCACIRQSQARVSTIRLGHRVMPIQNLMHQKKRVFSVGFRWIISGHGAWKRFFHQI